MTDGRKPIPLEATGKISHSLISLFRTNLNWLEIICISRNPIHFKIACNMLRKTLRYMYKYKYA